MQLIDNIPVWGSPVDEGAVRQIKNCAREADHVALMADHHLGYAVPIGGVVAYTDAISPSGVGFDIACGNKAVLTDANAAEVRANIGTIMDDVWKTVSFGVGRKNTDERVDNALFDDPAWSLRAIAPLQEMARQQLGTVGSGNHYVDIFRDEEDRVWVGVHFGSRGLGHKTATFFLNAAGAKDGMEVDPCVISAGSDLGIDYLECMRLAGRYAYAGRDWVCARVARILGAGVIEEVHNHHNFAWRETHQGRDLWVVRKGATPAFPGQKGFVGGTMGENSVILEGVESDFGKHFPLFHGSRRGPHHGPDGSQGKGE
jgi:tRNA-splicing ligase RtcB